MQKFSILSIALKRFLTLLSGSRLPWSETPTAALLPPKAKFGSGSVARLLMTQFLREVAQLNEYEKEAIQSLIRDIRGSRGLKGPLILTSYQSNSNIETISLFSGGDYSPESDASMPEDYDNLAKEFYAILGNLKSKFQIRHEKNSEAIRKSKASRDAAENTLKETYNIPSVK